MELYRYPKCESYLIVDPKLTGEGIGLIEIIDL